MQDIGAAMAWNILSSRTLVSPRRALAEARNSLALSLVKPQDRREEFRLFHPTAGTSVTSRGEMLLNVSPSGMALGVRRKCTFARGERYRITFDDGTTQADVEGRVCWTRSAWPRESVETQRGEYFQAAGFVIAEPLSNDQQERWKTLRDLVQDGSAAVDLKISPVR